MRHLIAGLLLCSTLSGTAFCLPPVTTDDRERRIAELLPFDEGGEDPTSKGRVVDPVTRKAAALQIDTFAAYLPDATDIRLGLGLVVWQGEKLRLTAQVANGGLGAGLAYKIVPVIDLSIGVGALYMVNDERVEPTIFASIYRW